MSDYVISLLRLIKSFHILSESKPQPTKLSMPQPLHYLWDFSSCNFSQLSPSSNHTSLIGVFEQIYKLHLWIVCSSYSTFLECSFSNIYMAISQLPQFFLTFTFSVKSALTTIFLIANWLYPFTQCTFLIPLSSLCLPLSLCLCLSLL